MVLREVQQGVRPCLRRRAINPFKLLIGDGVIGREWYTRLVHECDEKQKVTTGTFYHVRGPFLHMYDNCETG